MDPQKCLDILGKRHPHAHVNPESDLNAAKCCSDLEKVGLEQSSTIAESKSDFQHENLTTELSRMTLDEVVRAFFDLQSERVLAYKRFNNCLDDMLTEQTFGGCDTYPVLCGEITAIFSTISSGINHIKFSIESRGEHNIARSIESIQKLEEKKLSLVAAMHLGRMRRETKIWDTNGDFPNNLLSQEKTNLNSDIVSLEESISEELENLKFEIE